MPSQRALMQAGAWYSCLDAELEALRVAALEACHAHNHLPPGARRSLSAPLAALFAEAGAHCLIEAPFHCSYGFNIHLGAHVFINSGAVILDSAPVRIGDHSMIGPGAQIYCADHHRSAEERRRGIERALPVTIERDVWIGGRAILLPGVTVGAGAIVGAGAVVTCDVAPGARVVGTPARAL